MTIEKGSILEFARKTGVVSRGGALAVSVYGLVEGIVSATERQTFGAALSNEIVPLSLTAALYFAIPFASRSLARFMTRSRTPDPKAAMYEDIFADRFYSMKPYHPFKYETHPAEVWGLNEYGIHKIRRLAEVIVSETHSKITGKTDRFDMWTGKVSNPRERVGHQRIEQEFDPDYAGSNFRGLIFETKEQGLILILSAYYKGREAKFNSGMGAERARISDKNLPAFMDFLRRYQISAAVGNPAAFGSDQATLIVLNANVMKSFDPSSNILQKKYEQAVVFNMYEQFAMRNGLTNTEYLRLRLNNELPNKD